MQKEGENVILFLGTYPPRECGIATFTEDLSSAIEKKFYPALKIKIAAMNNNGLNVYNYPSKVIYQISDTKKEQYREVAEKINANSEIKIISIQHEFGIFGGEYGIYLLEFLKAVKKPVIITFHSILPEPDKKRKKTVQEISQFVKEIIVMTPKGKEILENEYEIKTAIRIIPHGIPMVAFESQNATKKIFGLSDKILLTSFGMMNSGKGYEYVIESLPEIVKKHPNLLYLIVGATHPNIRKHEGEKYRNFLQRKIKKLNLQENVKFYNKYVKLKEIIKYLKATDIYISSVLTPEQITSGTLAYAMGCGRATVSTPFLHAQDMINNERGILVEKFRDPKSFEKGILAILENQKYRKDVEQNSYEFTRHMTWPNVALAYGSIIKECVQLPVVYFEKLPRINTNHLRKMTDNFGIIQFANYSKPNKNSGYTLDDNSRALVIAAKLYTKYRNQNFLNLLKTYLNCIEHVQDDEGRLYNIISKDKTVNKKNWSEEPHGRAVQALGFLTSVQSLPIELKQKTKKILSKALLPKNEIHAPRAIASLIVGLYYYNKENYTAENIEAIKKFSEHLIESYEKNSEENWKWFESELTYSNSKLCEALFYAYIASQNEKCLNVAKESLNFLISKTFENNIFIPIGQNGWYKKNGERSYFDQQPIDVASMVKTLALAYEITKNPEYERNTLLTFNWFLGKNMLNQFVYNEKTGGCCDGLDKNDLNLNQGAESTVAYLSARLAVEEII